MSELRQNARMYRRVRKNFGSIPEIAVMPNLIEMQKKSYDLFLQSHIPHSERKDKGLQAVLKAIFPVRDFSSRAELHFDHYDLGDPKYDVDECRHRGLTYSAPLRVTLRLVVFDVDDESGVNSIRDIKEQGVYVGDIPLMTNSGTFIINGIERVVVSQMHRSPGVFYDHDNGKGHSSGKYLFSARIIPYRGSWLDFEFDAKSLIYVRIDRRRKLPVTTFLMALDSQRTEALRAEYAQQNRPLAIAEAEGMTRDEILGYFYESIPYQYENGGWRTDFVPDKIAGVKLNYELVDADSGEVLAQPGVKLTVRQARLFKERGVASIRLPQEALQGCYVAQDVVNQDSGLVYIEAGELLDAVSLDDLVSKGVETIAVLAIDGMNVGPYIRDTLLSDKNQTREDALIDIYRILRPGEPLNLESADNLFRSLFFDEERYDLSEVGRVKLNARLDRHDSDRRVLSKQDILSILKLLIDIKDGKGEVDDIDHLGNRRVRSVGELMENQYRIGLLRMERSIRERMNAVEIDSIMPTDLIHAKPVTAAIREFFGASQLSQFMDQTNPLAEVTHKRRLSALGPGGLTRERAGFEVRDVHPTHYGRICPIETPEGPNIGLINSLATYARVNHYGFIESPYRKVKDGRVTDEIIYISAMDEDKYTIAQANSPVDGQGYFTAELVTCRQGSNFALTRPQLIDLVDVSPKQLVSVASALIPFLENDDANRALMGSNMQRQAVPLIQSEAPLIGTGMETCVACDSGVVVLARRAGQVDQVDATRIVVRVTDEVGNDEPGVDIYRLLKFQRSNQNTCVNQQPLVKIGDHVQAGDILADGPATDLGELALGRNVLAAFMPWNGYNFEDSILISERLARDDVFTSIHIEEFEVMARDTKLGPEDITRDISNVGEEALKNLDEAGIVFIGAEIEPGDILVGKVTPRGETPSTPEEKLLRAIFGEKASDVRDTSLRVPPGVSGTVVDVRVFSRRGLDKDERAVVIERGQIAALAQDHDDERSILQRSFHKKLKQLLIGHKAVAGPKGFPIGEEIEESVLNSFHPGQWQQIDLDHEGAQNGVEALRLGFDNAIEKLKKRFESKVDKIQSGDELPPGVLKIIKVFIAVKRKIQPGDKMAGRHGNKGVVSKIIPIEDMPYLEDGTPVDIVLNPLGVPSRMNIGQILETHLGWAMWGLGRRIGKIIDQCREEGAFNLLREAITEVYAGSQDRALGTHLNDEDLVNYAETLRSGVPAMTPVFDGARESNIADMLKAAGFDSSGQMVLYDGRTGEPFSRKITVGWIYMLKLYHLVDDKIHARSIGPYSLVTQQPLGGKAQFGGQRFGEMEVWALEAYGAAYTLQEMLTIKSDDVAGRTRVYEAIVRGEDNFEAGMPESFNVLVKELKALCLNVDLHETSP